MYGAKAPGIQNSARFSKVAQKVSALRWAFSLDTLILWAVHMFAALWYMQSLTEQPTLCTVFSMPGFSFIENYLRFGYYANSISTPSRFIPERAKSMSLFAIGDLHLALGAPEKTMEVFGGRWVG